MHLHILGVGPIGSLVAHHLRNVLPPSHSITLMAKTLRQRQALMQKGSIVLDRRGVTMPSQGDFLYEITQDGPEQRQDESLRITPSTAPIDSLIVALKAQYTVQAIQNLAPRLNANSTIVLMQNGMGMYEQLARDVFRNPIQRPHFILTSNTHGAFMQNPAHVVHAGLGSIEFSVVPEPDSGRDFELGLHDETIPPSERRLRLSDISMADDPNYQRYRSLRELIAAFLLAKPLNAFWVPYADLQVKMREKLVINAVINPLTSIMNCRNGELFAHEPARQLAYQVAQEASEIYAAQLQSEYNAWMSEYNLDPVDNPMPPLPQQLTSPALSREVIRVAEITKGNISSMLQDTRRGRLTEIEFINGYLEGLGKEFGIKTPAISMLRNLVDLKYFLPMNHIV